MSLKTLLVGLGKRLLPSKKVSSSPATGQQQKLITYDKQSATQTGQELAKKELNLPAVTQPLNKTKNLYMGDKTAPAFGSSTYDWVMKKGRGKFGAEDWIDHLTSTRTANFKIFGRPAKKTIRDEKRFKYDSGPFQGKEVSISKEELFDSNLAIFNDAGDLTGGLLYAAKKFGIKLDANEVGAMLKLNPVNRLKPVELGLPKGAVEALEKAQPQLLDEAKKLQSIVEIKGLAAIKDELDGAVYALSGMKGGADQVSSAARESLTRLKNISKSTNLSQNEKQRVNKLIGEIDKTTQPFKDKTIATRYGNEASYTLQGGNNYRETVMKLDEPIVGNSSPFKTFGHFDGVNKNMIYHVRFDTRYTPDGKKAFLIHEIQSDANQTVAKNLNKLQQLGGEKRVNPFQADLELGLLVNNRSKMLKEMDEAIKKGLTGRAQSIAKDLKDVNQKIQRTYGQRADNYGSGQKYDYFPMVEADSYGDHALKYLLNKAAKENVDYVAVAPFDKLSFRQGYKAGNERFYGYASGKGIGGKGSAVMPNLMKKVGRFYDSNTGPVKISLSDPKMPYKKIRTDEFKYPDNHPKAGKRIKSIFHDKATMSKEVADDLSYKFVPDNDPNLYFDSFAIKVTPMMKDTFKTYKSTGGLVVDLFKPIR